MEINIKISQNFPTLIFHNKTLLAPISNAIPSSLKYHFHIQIRNPVNSRDIKHRSRKFQKHKLTKLKSSLLKYGNGSEYQKVFSLNKLRVNIHVGNIFISSSQKEEHVHNQQCFILP